MTNTVNVLVAPIADSVVARISARSEQGLSNRLKGGIFDCRSEAVLRVVAMLIVNEACNAEVKVLASSAGNKALVCKFCVKISRRIEPSAGSVFTLDTRVASTGRCDNILLGGNESGL